MQPIMAQYSRGMSRHYRYNSGRSYGDMVEVTVREPGTLEERMPKEMQERVRMLRIEGPLNERDLAYITKLAKRSKVLNAEGKTVIIIPDNDGAGRKYARRIKRKIPWSVIKELPELEEKEDIYDWLLKGHSVTEIDSLPETEYPEEEHPETEQKAYHDIISTYKKSQGKLMLELFEKEGVEIFFNENNTPFVEFPVGEHSEVYPLDSSTFRQWAEMVFNQYTDKTIKRDGLNEALSIISAKSKFSDTPIHTVHNRVADYNSDFWYDLSNKSWTAVRTNTKGQTTFRPGIILCAFIC